MNNQPQKILCKIITEHGRSICSKPKQFEGLLRDRCINYDIELNLMLNAFREGIASDFIATNNAEPIDMLLVRLKNKLQNNQCLFEDAAIWAVESWALALEVCNKNDLEIFRINHKQPETNQTGIHKSDSKSNETIRIQPNVRDQTLPVKSSIKKNNSYFSVHIAYLATITFIYSNVITSFETILLLGMLLGIAIYFLYSIPSEKKQIAFFVVMIISLVLVSLPVLMHFVISSLIIFILEYFVTKNNTRYASEFSVMCVFIISIIFLFNGEFFRAWGFLGEIIGLFCGFMINNLS